MLSIFPRFKDLAEFSFLLVLLTISSCKEEHSVPIPDVSALDIAWDFQRFDEALFAVDTANYKQEMAKLAAKYPSFLPFYAEDLLEIGPPEVQNKPQERLRFYLSNTDTRALHDSCIAVFQGLEKEEKQLKRAFQLYAHYFNKNKSPRVITHTSAFGPMAFTLGSEVLGINLEMFLGKDFSLYPSAGFPDYLTYSFEQECLAPMAVKTWLNEQHPIPLDRFRFIDQMVHQGKILYLLDRLLPETADQYKIGYSKEQLEWCKGDEAQIWAFFIEKKLLYESESMKYFNYITEGPTSPGMPFESPGKIGAWVGWQIVRKYMQRNPETSLEDLMRMNDGQSILSKSKYKPS